METVLSGPPDGTVRRTALLITSVAAASVLTTLGLSIISMDSSAWASLVVILVAIIALGGVANMKLRQLFGRRRDPVPDRAVDSATASGRRLQAIVSSIPEMLMISRDGLLDYVNAGGLTMLAASSADILLARPVLDMVDGVTSAEIRARLERALAAGEAFPPSEIWVARLDGSSLCVEISGVPMPTSSGAEVLLIARDISAHRRTEADLRDAKEQAELANRTRSQFVANMSHELRTPLNAIIGFSEIIADESFGPTGQPLYTEYARDIRDGGRHLLTVINDILDYAKAEDGKMELYEDITDLHVIIGASVRVMIGRAENADVRVRQEIEENLPHVLADAMKLKQVLLNLVSNAVKFTARGGSVTISAGSASDGGLDIAVLDTGIGMTEAEVRVALEPFTQIESDLNRKYEGTGLGLPITNSLVKLHGGRLLIDSTPGVGTRVTVHLPAARIFRQASQPTLSAS
jgi:PAS domain S-box-containing protein